MLRMVVWVINSQSVSFTQADLQPALRCFELSDAFALADYPQQDFSPDSITWVIAFAFPFANILSQVTRVYANSSLAVPSPVNSVQPQEREIKRESLPLASPSRCCFKMPNVRSSPVSADPEKVDASQVTHDGDGGMSHSTPTCASIWQSRSGIAVDYRLPKELLHFRHFWSEQCQQSQSLPTQPYCPSGILALIFSPLKQANSSYPVRRRSG